MKKKIVFYFPWKEISGGPVYLSNLAIQLSKLSDYEVWYIDYLGGLTDKSFAGTSVKQISYQEPFYFPLSDEIITMIVPIYCAAHIPKLHPKSKILFVNWHNYCIQALVDSWRLKEDQLQEFLTMVHDNNATVFIDYTHWRAQNEYVRPNNMYRFAQQYVPVTAGQKNIICSNNIIRKEEINIGILGRLCRDKIYTVLNLIEQFDKIDIGRKKNLYIIGDGTEREKLLSVTTSSVNIHIMGTITGECLSDFLCKHVDILFGMGLSILEGAAMGIPSVVAPHNIQPFHLDAYTFLHKCKGYALGWYDTQISELNIEVLTLRQILSMVYEEGKKEELGKRDLQYMIDHHTQNHDLLCKYIDTTSLTYERFSKFSKDKGYIRILSIPVAKIHSSFDERDKRVDFLGISNFLCAKIDGEIKKFYLLGREENIIKAKKIGKDYRLYIAGMQVPMIKL